MQAQDAEILRVTAVGEQATAAAQAAQAQPVATAQAAAATAAATQPAPPGPPRERGLDTRQLAKPDVFKGETLAWKEWSTVFRSYAGVAYSNLGPLIKRAETEPGPMQLVNSNLTPQEVTSSCGLHHLLINLCRGLPLTIVINAGDREGLVAWQSLILRFEPKLRPRQAGQLMELLKFPFVGTCSRNWASLSAPSTIIA
jgi:hypothetical protein